MGRKRKEKTLTISIRIPAHLKPFLSSLENRNTFILNLIETSEELKRYEIAKRESENEPNLFKDLL